MDLEIIDNFVVAGYASVGIEDRVGDRFTPEMLKRSAEKYNGIVYYCHKWDQPAGLILKSHRANGKIYKTCIDNVGWYVVSRPTKARADIIPMIKEGLLSGYSIGGRRVLDNRGRLVEVEISDVSYVPRPMNKLSYHRVISKSDNIHKRIRKAKSFAEVDKIIKEWRVI